MIPSRGRVTPALDTYSACGGSLWLLVLLVLYLVPRQTEKWCATFECDPPSRRALSQT